MRVRMSWTWVGNDDGCFDSNKAYPIFIYTTFLTHNLFLVKIVKGKKGNQNAPGHGPSAPAWMKYKQSGFASKQEVVDRAILNAELKLFKERNNDLH